MLRLAAERGGDPDRAGKRDPLDPLLWRGAREGEPAWDGGPLGPGRPDLGGEPGGMSGAAWDRTVQGDAGGSGQAGPAENAEEATR